MSRSILFALVFLFWPLGGKAQNTPSLEAWLDLLDDNAQLSELLEEVRQNPVVINSAEKADWQRIPLLPESLIDKILRARKQKGPFDRLSSLRPIVGKEWYRRIRPFIKLNPYRHHYGYVIQRNGLKSDAPFFGRALTNYSKMYWHPNKKFDAGVVAQKDAGESQWADYLNGYFQFKNRGLRCIIGSFFLHLGQGLLFSSPFGQMKSTLVTLPLSISKDRAAPYLGTAENLALTGMFVHLRLKSHSSLRLMWTRTLRDARFNSRTGKIVALDYSGYHRTQKERMGKDLLQEDMQGINFVYEGFTYLQLGLTAVQFAFSPSIAYNAENIPFAERRRRFYQFRGHRLSLGSLYYRFENTHLSSAGEFALSNLKRTAFNQTLFVKTSSVRFGFLLWQIQRDFQTPLGRVFDDHAPFPQAQQGVYAAWDYAFRGGTFRFYKMLKKDLWRTYSEPMPGLKDEWLLQGSVNFQAIGLNMRLRQRREENLANNLANHGYINTSFRLEIGYGGKGNATFRTRAEMCRVAPFSEKGLSLFQDVRLEAGKSFTGFFRLTFFRTQSFTSRIYEYENDVPGSFANVALFGQGFKWYVHISYRLTGYFRLWLKYRYLHLNERNFNTISYGHLVQPVQRLLRIQAQIRF